MNKEYGTIFAYKDNLIYITAKKSEQKNRSLLIEEYTPFLLNNKEKWFFIFKHDFEGPGDEFPKIPIERDEEIVYLRPGLKIIENSSLTTYRSIGYQIGQDDFQNINYDLFWPTDTELNEFFNKTDFRYLYFVADEVNNTRLILTYVNFIKRYSMNLTEDRIKSKLLGVLIQSFENVTQNFDDPRLIELFSLLVNIEKESIGGIIRENSNSYDFKAMIIDSSLRVGDYLLVSDKQEDGKIEEVLCQIYSLEIEPEFRGKGLDPKSFSVFISEQAPASTLFANCKVLGYISDEGSIEFPRKPLQMYSVLRVPTDERLKKFFEIPNNKALKIGALLNKSSVPVYLDVNRLDRHLAILAQTGGGKSYLTGIFIEELAAKGATIIIIDPHGDHIFLGESVNSKDITPWQSRVKVYVNPKNPSALKVKNIVSQGIIEFDLQIDSITSNDLIEIIGVPSNAHNIRKYIRNVYDDLKSKENLTVESFLTKIKDDADNNNNSSALSVLSRIENINFDLIFGLNKLDISKLANRCSINVLCFAGLDLKTSQIYVSHILSKLYNQQIRVNDPSPCYILIEEAHRFVPAKSNPKSKAVINNIAGEGRKFGMFQILISQRPSKIDSDSLSQCNSQIILRVTNPRDQQAIENASEQMSRDLYENLPGLNRGEAIIVGPITKMPVMIKTRKRITKEGGIDIDSASKLESDLRDYEIGHKLDKKSKQDLKDFDGTFRDD